MFESNDTMTGTTGTTFNVVGRSNAGRVGFRDLGDGSFRVRVEPNDVDGSVSFGEGWTQPSDEQSRFSTVVKGTERLASAVAFAQKQLDLAAITDAISGLD